MRLKFNKLEHSFKLNLTQIFASYLNHLTLASFIFTFLNLIIIIGTASSTYSLKPIYRDCDIVFQDVEYGIIFTPNFPKYLHVPIKCQWIIYSSFGKLITLYFTQFYLRNGLSIHEYTFFVDNSVNVGKSLLYSSNFDLEGPQYLTTNKSYLVIDLELDDLENTQFRNQDHFMNVYGFNISFQITTDQQSINNSCSTNSCSLNGHCMVNYNFRKFYCDCFLGYYGDKCQFGPKCDPKKGINPCPNGDCRYSKGSRLIECICPSLLTSNQCQQISYNKCGEDGCSNSCFLLIKSNGLIDTSKCRCSYFNSSFVVKSNQACSKPENMRFVIEFKMIGFNIDLSDKNSFDYQNLKRELELTAQTNLQPYLDITNAYLKVVQIKPEAVVQTRFFSNIQNSDAIENLLRDKLKFGRLGQYPVDREYLKFQKYPALSILSITSNEKMPLMEGSQLTINCNIIGSLLTQVIWYKDEMVIDFNGTNIRNISRFKYPQNDKGVYIEVLQIDRVYFLDNGLFTCEAWDLNYSIKKSLIVKVETKPNLWVTPIAQSWIDNESISVFCVAEQESEQNGYHWLKNGKIINPSEGDEQIEDLYPTGSRLLIKKLKQSAIYTCLVTSPWGTSSQTSTISIISNEDNVKTCPNQIYQDTVWQESAIDTQDIKLCPLKYQDGYVSRKCTVDGKWDEPDYSKCSTGQLIELQTKFQSLLLCYPITSLVMIINQLKLHLTSHQLQNNEGERFVFFLLEMLDYIKYLKASKFNLSHLAETALDIFSMLFDYPHSFSNITTLSTLNHVIVDYILIIANNNHSSHQQIKRDNFFAEIIKLESNFGLVHFPLTKHSHTLSSWLTDSVKLNLSTNLPSNGQSSKRVVIIFYKNFEKYIPQHFVIRRESFDLEYQIYSKLVTVAVIEDFDKQNYGTGLKIAAQFSHVNKSQSSTLSFDPVCGFAELTQRIHYQTNQCQTNSTEPSSSSTICVCHVTGMYTIILTNQSPKYSQPPLVFSSNFFILIGSLSSLFLNIMTLISLAVRSRLTFNTITWVKFNICCSLVGLNCSLIVIYFSHKHQFLIDYVIALMLFFHLSTLSLELCFCAIVYAEVSYSTNKFVQNSSQKIILVGWVIPVAFETSILFIKLFRDLHDEWTLNYKYFYANYIAAVVITCLHFVIYLTIRIELKHKTNVESLINIWRIKSSLSLIHQSLIITICCNYLLASNYLYLEFKSSLVEYNHLTASIFMALLVLVYFSFYKENNLKLSQNINMFSNNDTVLEGDKGYYIPSTSRLRLRSIQDTIN